MCEHLVEFIYLFICFLDRFIQQRFPFNIKFFYNSLIKFSLFRCEVLIFVGLKHNHVRNYTGSVSNPRVACTRSYWS